MEISEIHTRLAEYLKEYYPDFYQNIFSQKDYSFNTRIIREFQTRMKRFDEYI
jgi:hypothetical protein